MQVSGKFTFRLLLSQWKETAVNMNMGDSQSHPRHSGGESKHGLPAHIRSLYYPGSFVDAHIFLCVCPYRSHVHNDPEARAAGA